MRKNKSIVIGNILILTLYVSINLLISYFHESWRDEAQAWVLVKNSSIKEIFSLCASEGHPCLWFMFLYPFTRIGFSFYYFSLISITVMTICAYTMLMKVPLDFISKVFWLFSPLFLYYNAVICRIYCILLLLVLLLCVLWKDRNNKPLAYGVLTALLFQSHVLIIGLAIGCVIDMIVSLTRAEKVDSVVKKKRIIGLVISIISFFITILELKQDKNTETFINVNKEYILSRLNYTGIRTAIIRYYVQFGKNTGKILLILFLAFVLVMSSLAIKDCYYRMQNILAIIVFIVGTIVYWGMIILIRAVAHIQMALVFWMLLLFFCVVLEEYNSNKVNKRIIHWFVILIMIFSLPCLYYDIKNDIKGQFSGAKEIVQIIDERVSNDSTIVLRNNMTSVSIYAYLCENEKLSIWDIDNSCEFKIHKWGKKNRRNLEETELLSAIMNDLENSRHVYYVSDSRLKNDSSVRLIAFNTSTSKWNEDYWVYQIW